MGDINCQSGSHGALKVSGGVRYFRIVGQRKPVALLYAIAQAYRQFNPRSHTAYFITRTQRGGMMHPPRVLKLRVVELSENNSGLLSTSTREW